MMKRVFGFLVVFVLMGGPAFGALLLAPGDVVIAVDPDPAYSNSSYPGGEEPPKALDNNADTKYLNFGGRYSGFIVTAGSSTVQSFTLTTANDADDRDPASWELYGTNDAIVSADNSMGRDESWALIGTGSVSLPAARKTTGPVVYVSNSTAYTSYRMIYPDLKGWNSIMQVADVAFYSTTDGTGPSILGASDPILAIQERPDSRYPPHEGPGNVVDNSLGKYLNFGKENSGFIVTPQFGASIIQGFQVTTANDAEERDPASWELYGTNDAIVSGQDSTGDLENWVLIDSGSLSLPTERDTLADLVSVSSSAAYTSYKMLFPTVKDAGAANSMQIAEVQFFGVPEPATVCLLGLGGLSLLRRRKR
jgi:hypothetical protein